MKKLLFKPVALGVVATILGLGAAADLSAGCCGGCNRCCTCKPACPKPCPPKPCPPKCTCSKCCPKPCGCGCRYCCNG